MPITFLHDIRDGTCWWVDIGRLIRFVCTLARITSHQTFTNWESDHGVIETIWTVNVITRDATERGEIDTSGWRVPMALRRKIRGTLWRWKFPRSILMNVRLETWRIKKTILSPKQPFTVAMKRSIRENNYSSHRCCPSLPLNIPFGTLYGLRGRTLETLEKTHVSARIQFHPQ